MSLEIVIILFILYSICGWIVEVIDKLILDKKFVNRGFLIGPYCPIYGCGCLAFVFLLNRYLDDPLALFVMAVLICGILEYITSYLMEKIFKTRWWDYSEYPFNINGRICLGTLILFGIGGLAVSYLLHPFFMNILLLIPTFTLKIISIILSVIFIVDNIVSFKIIYNFRIVANNVRKDNTEEITTKVKEELMKKSGLIKRLVKAFPNFKSILKKMRSEKNEKL